MLIIITHFTHLLSRFLAREIMITRYFVGYGRTGESKKTYLKSMPDDKIFGSDYSKFKLKYKINEFPFCL